MIVVLDVGSSSLRSSLWERDGSSLGEKARIEQAGTGELEADPLLGRVARVLDRAAADGREVTAVATSTFWHCLLGLDDRGRPITPVYSWADARSAPHAAELRERLDEQAIHARTGCRLHSSYWPAKLAWLRDTQPETFARVAVWVSPGEYVHRRLLGDAAVSVSMASGTGLFDQHACEWDRELAAHLGVQDKLPAIDDSPRVGLTGDWAERWPALADVPWFPAWGDGATSNVGAGCVTKDRAALMIGTSGALRVLDRADPPEPPPSLWCYRADAERPLLGGSLSDGGSVVAWLRSLTRLPEPEEAEREIAKMAPDSHGLTLLPLLSGERGPGWSDRAGAAIEGLTAATTPLHLLRAGLEAVRAALRAARRRPAGRPHDRRHRRRARELPRVDADRRRRAGPAGGALRRRRGLEPRRRRDGAGGAGRAAGRGARGRDLRARPGGDGDLPRRARAPAGALRAGAHIESGASTPRRPSDRAMTALVARTSPSRSERRASEPASRTGQSR